MTTEENDADARLDKWLWHARFYKTRSLATAAITGGKVHLNAERIKPAHRVRIGDHVSLSLQGMVAEFQVLGLPPRRGPASEMQSSLLRDQRERAAAREVARAAALGQPDAPAAGGKA